MNKNTLKQKTIKLRQKALYDYLCEKNDWVLTEDILKDLAEYYDLNYKGGRVSSASVTLRNDCEKISRYYQYPILSSRKGLKLVKDVEEIKKYKLNKLTKHLSLCLKDIFELSSLRVDTKNAKKMICKLLNEVRDYE